MPASAYPDDDLPEDDLAQDEDDEEQAAGRCPLCEMLAGECDHLVASIDLTYSELVAGAIFAHERMVLDLMEHLVLGDPEALKAAGAGPALEQVAALVKAETEDGASPGDAVSMHYPQLMGALSHMLQEDEDVAATAIDAPSEEDSAVEHLWARQPEWIVDRLIERLERVTEEVDQA
jgi:hypothetical protein